MNKIVFAMGILLMLVFTGCTGGGGESNPSVPVTQASATPIPTPAVPMDLDTDSSSSPLDEFISSIGMEFVLIPTGEFDMGSPPSEWYRHSNEGPIHRVKISKPFYMGKYEVTQRQWKEVMGDNPSYFEGCDDCPVEQVSWDDVQEFIRRLNQKEGTDKYRLPTEAEWEYATRAGTKTAYSFGDDEVGYAFAEENAWYYGNSGRKTHPVGQVTKPNPWGLYDMHGNVYEWVYDWYDFDYYESSPSVDPQGPSSGTYTSRVVRGGIWNCFDRICRSAYRDGVSPDKRIDDLGFRLARSVPQENYKDETSPPAPTDAPETPAPTPIVPADSDRSFTNSISMEFVLIPSDKFDMGSPESEKGRDSDEGPVHHVTISKPFYIGKYEVTQKQWKEVMGDNPSYFNRLGCDDCPVEQVSWPDVQEFIKRLNQKEGTDKYRLPTEAEWEYAARAGTKTRYSFGDDESMLGKYGWCGRNTVATPNPVGQKKPNPWGLYDVHGNVWEWVQDRYDSDYYENSPSVDPQGPSSGSIHVSRGGGYFPPYEGYCRSASRSYSSDSRGSYYLGFRLARQL